MFGLKKYTLLLANILILAISQTVFAQSNDYENALQAYQLKDIDTAHIHLKNALQQDPSNLPAKLLLAEVLIEKHDYSLAELTLKDALKQGADFNIVVEPLGRSLLLQSKFDAVLSYADNKPLNETAQLANSLLKANAYQKTDLSELAISEYDNVLSERPNNIESILGLASIHIYANKLQKALPWLAKAEALVKDNNKLWQLKGLVAQKKGLISEAIMAFKHANAIEKSNLMTLRMMASAYIQQEELEHADSILEQILTIYPYDPQARFMRSTILKSINKDEIADQILMELSNQLSNVDLAYLQSSPQLQLIDAMTDYAQENWEEASKKFQFYLNKNKNDINVNVMLADTYIKLDQPNRAVELLSEHEDELLKNKGFAILLAGLYLEFDSKFKAEFLLRKLRELYPDDATILILLAELLDSVGQYEEALSLLEDNPIKGNNNYIHSLASAYFGIGKFEQSFQHLNVLLKISPNNIDYKLLQVKLLFQVNQFEKATDIINALYTKHSDVKKVAESYIFLQLKLGNTTEARKLLNNLLDIYPDDSNNWLMLANIEQTLGNITDAIAILKRQQKKQDYKRQATFQLAEIYFEQQKFEENLSEADALLKDNRLDGDVIVLKARSLIALTRIKEAKHQLNILSGLWTEDAGKLLKLSQLQQQAKDYPSAENSLDRALHLQPNSLPILLATIKLKIKINQLTQATKLITQIEKKSDNGHIVFTLLKGDIANAKNDIGQAFHYYFQVLKTDETNTIALIKLSKAINTTARSSEFSSYLSNMVSQHPTRTFQRYILADHLINHGQFEQAKDQYKQLLTYNISDHRKGIALNNLANIYLIEKNYHAAVNLSQQAIEILGDVPEFLDTAGWSLTLLGEPENGLLYLRHAFSMSSSNREIQYHIAYSLVKLGRYQEAKAILQKQLAFPNELSDFERAQKLLNDINDKELKS
jgi:tetratricopeptide (TPR) repeat protein